MSSATWKWRFTTKTPAAPYRAALIQDLAGSYVCRQERRFVSCTRSLPGDRLRLELQAHPSMGATLVKAKMTAMAD